MISSGHASGTLFFFMKCLRLIPRCLSWDSSRRDVLNLSCTISCRVPFGIFSETFPVIFGFWNLKICFRISRSSDSNSSAIHQQRNLRKISSDYHSEIPSVVPPSISQQISFEIIEESTGRIHEGSTGRITE